MQTVAAGVCVPKRQSLFGSIMGSDSMIKASALPTGWYIKVAHGVNLHKFIIMPVTAALMWHYSCYT